MFTCVNIDNAGLKGCYIKDNSMVVKERPIKSSGSYIILLCTCQ